MEAIIVDESLLPVSPGNTGELLMTGPQLTPGYLDDPSRTAAAFTVPPGKQEIYYRTGDIVREIDDKGTMVFLGRVDHQIKVNGYRVELGEIEAAVREVSSVDEVVALGWPLTSTGAGANDLALASDKVDVEQQKERLQERLPKYAEPRNYYCFDRLPMTPNGKVDRRAVIQWLEDSA
jgi:acyl-coenzyme A synthetase/AMP-(fatty) acid ligase